MNEPDIFGYNRLKRINFVLWKGCFAIELYKSGNVTNKLIDYQQFTITVKIIKYFVLGCSIL